MNFGLPSLSWCRCFAKFIQAFERSRGSSLCRSFDALAQTAYSVLGCDPFTGHLFVFRNKRGDRLKILFWDRSGFVIWYKRLEQGFFKWLPSEDAAAPTRIEISAPDMAFILEGIDMSGAKRQRRYQRPSAS